MDRDKGFGQLEVKDELEYHIIWCPKFRRQVLTDDIAFRLGELILGRADDLGITIEEMEIMPDHVHLFVKSSPILAPDFIVQQLKGKSSRCLQDEFLEL